MIIPFDGNFTANDLRATLQGLGNDIFFVQVGAMDGVRFDPIHDTAVEKKWRGILVEPMPDLFALLTQNYKGQEGLVFENEAIADFEGEIEMTRIDPRAVEKGVFEDIVLGFSTLMPDRGFIDNENMRKEVRTLLHEHTQTIKVACERLPVLLRKRKVEKVDLFVVDTEGADWMVARQLDLEIYKPRVVYMEFAHLPAYERTACSNHFRNYGYRIFVEEGKGENFLAVKQA